MYFLNKIMGDEKTHEIPVPVPVTRSSVICYYNNHLRSELRKDNREESWPSESDSVDVSSSAFISSTSEILENKQLIISQTSAVNLMSIPTQRIREMEIKIQEANKNSELFSPDILLVAKMELAFILSKDSVSFWTESFTLERLLKSIEEDVCTPIICTSVQVNTSLKKHLKSHLFFCQT